MHKYIVVVQLTTRLRFVASDYGERICVDSLSRLSITKTGTAKR